MRVLAARTHLPVRSPRPRAADLRDACPACLRVCTPRVWMMTRSYTAAVYLCPRCGTAWPCWWARDLPQRAP